MKARINKPDETVTVTIRPHPKVAETHRYVFLRNARRDGVIYGRNFHDEPLAESEVRHDQSFRFVHGRLSGLAEPRERVCEYLADLGAVIV